jgi:hypothetical protein
VSRGVLWLVATLGLVLACAPGADPLEGRAERIEARLLASCSCHPKKIEGLPIEREIRAEIRRLLAEDLDDDAILWAVLERHGTALLEAGIEDVEVRAAAVLVETAVILLLSAAVLLLQLRRSPRRAES